MSRIPINLACQHLKSTGHRYPSRVASQLARLLKNNGMKFTIDYISKISDAVKATLIHGNVTLPEGIKTRRFLKSDGTRVVLCAYKWIQSAINTAVYIHENNVPLDHPMAKKVHALINLKHVFKFSEVQPHHIEKFNDSIENPTFREWSKVGGHDLRRVDVRTKPIKNASEKIPEIPSLYSYQMTEKKSPILLYHQCDIDRTKPSLGTAESYDPRSRDIIPLILLFKRMPLTLRKAFMPNLKTMLHYKCNMDFGYLFGKAQRALSKKNIHHGDQNIATIVGKISHLMETGGKDRAIAQPFLAIQIFFEPLKKILEDMTKADPHIYTFDQQKGIDDAMAALKKDGQLFCFDASSFTDKYPLEYQLTVLKQYGLNHWANALEVFVQGTFWDPKQGRSVCYKQGQPQGLGPSFHLVTLAHSDMIRSIYKSIYGLKYKELLKIAPYAIVGDDAWISDPNVAQAYLKIMDAWGVSINQTKSVVSDTYGEFCGSLFTEDTRMPAYKPKEWRLDVSTLSSSYNYYGKNWLKNLDILQKNSNIKDRKRYSVPESIQDRTVFNHTLASKGGGMRRLGAYTFLSKMKMWLSDFVVRFEKTTKIGAPHYDSLIEFTREAVNLNYYNGFHTSRFKTGGTPTFKVGKPIVPGYQTGSEFLYKFLHLQNISFALNTIEDVDALIDLSKEVQTEDDFMAYQALFKNVLENINEIESYKVSLPEGDPRETIELPMDVLMEDVNIVKELLKEDPRLVMVDLDPKVLSTSGNPHECDADLKTKAKLKFRNPK